MGGDQPAGEVGAGLAIPLNGVQSSVQLAHHVGQYGNQLAPLFCGCLGLDGPNQLLHGLSGQGVVLLTRCLIHPGPRHHLTPLGGQEGQQERSNGLLSRQSLYALVDQLIGMRKGLLPGLPRTLELGHWLYTDLGLLFGLEQEFGELAQQVNKQSQVILELGQNALHGVLYAHVQGVLFAFLWRPGYRSPGQRVHQAPRRVLIGQEEVAVNHGRLEHRDLQATNDELHLYRDGLVGEHEVKHFSQRVDGPTIQFRCMADLVAVAHLAQHIVVGKVLCVVPLRVGWGSAGTCPGLQGSQITHEGRTGSRILGARLVCTVCIRKSLGIPHVRAALLRHTGRSALSPKAQALQKLSGVGGNRSASRVQR